MRAFWRMWWGRMFGPLHLGHLDADPTRGSLRQRRRQSDLLIGCPYGDTVCVDCSGWPACVSARAIRALPDVSPSDPRQP